MVVDGYHEEVVGNSPGTGRFVTVEVFEAFAQRMEGAMRAVFQQGADVTATSPHRPILTEEGAHPRRAGKEHGEELERPRRSQFYSQVSRGASRIRLREEEEQARYQDTLQVKDRRRVGGRSPFCEEILAAPVPEGFKDPAMNNCSGRDDPIRRGKRRNRRNSRRRNKDRVSQECQGRIRAGEVGVSFGEAELGSFRKTNFHQAYRQDVTPTSQAPSPLEENTFSEEGMLRDENPFHEARVIDAIVEDFTVN